MHGQDSNTDHTATHYSIASCFNHVTLAEGGVQCLGAEMEYFYKDHRVEISVGLDGDGWVVSLFIYYSDNLQNLLVTFPMDQTFKTYDLGNVLRAHVHRLHLPQRLQR